MTPTQAPLMHVVTMLAFALHVGGGALGLVSGAVAIVVRKGGSLHRKAGTVFVASMLVMAVFGFYLVVAMSDQVNVFISAFAFYLIATGWLTVRRKDDAIGLSEKIALVVAVCLCAPFAILAFQLATGLTLMLTSTVALKGPVLIAIYVFTSVLMLAAIGDARLVWAGGIAGVPRISRHL